MPEFGHIVVAPDKFKGSLTAPEVAAHVALGLHRFRPAVQLRLVPVADGGDGTLDALAECGFVAVPIVASGPTGEQIKANYGLREGTAVVELAETSGLRRLPLGRLDATHASSHGVGDVVRAALLADCSEIIIGLGDGACTDGGAGLLQALGARLLDRQSRELGPGGAALQSLHTIDLDGLEPGLDQVRITLIGDVGHPLLGPDGAVATQAAEKGATPAEITQLEYALHNWAELLAAATGHDVSSVPGAGAGGGVGFAALAVLGAAVRPGVEFVLELMEFDQRLAGARLVITGEEALDRHSLTGQAAVEVAAAAGRHGVPTIAVTARSSLTGEELRAAGLWAAYSLTGVEPDPSVRSANAGELLEELTATVVAPVWLSQ